MDMDLQSYLFDTTVFNTFLKHPHKGDVETLRGKGHFYVTHFQRDELWATPESKTKGNLLSLFYAIAPKQVATKTSVIGYSKLGAAELSDGVIFNEILSGLNECERKRGKKRKDNRKDALIGETAERNGYIMVSDDRCLCKVMCSRGVHVMDWNTFNSTISAGS